MSLELHLDELVEKHRALEQTIAEEMSRPYADDLHIAELKKRKLQLKDEINRLQAGEEAVQVH